MKKTVLNRSINCHVAMIRFHTVERQLNVLSRRGLVRPGRQCGKNSGFFTWRKTYDEVAAEYKRWLKEINQ